MEVKDIHDVLIVGAGTMGRQIGAQCAIHGYRVVLYDLDQTTLDQALGGIAKLLDFLVSSRKISADAARAAEARVLTSTDLPAAAAGADLVSESVPEDPLLKGRILAQLNAVCPARTIFTTNTSTLLPSAFAAASGRPDKVVALHFHDTRVTDVVDVMPHPGSSPETVRLVIDFAVSIGQVPIVLRRESAGYVFNAMLSAWFHSAQTLAANDITSVEEIDRAWMGVMRAPMGPFGVMDSVGIDTVWKVTEHKARMTQDPQDLKNARFLEGYVHKGLLGQKSGRGFYTYPHPAFKHPDFVKGRS